MSNPAAFRVWSEGQQGYEDSRFDVGMAYDSEWPEIVLRMVEQLKNAQSTRKP